MKIVAGVLLSGLIPLLAFSQPSGSPAQARNYSGVTSYEELSAYVKLLDGESDLLQSGIIGESVQGRGIFALKFSASEFGKDPSKIRVMIFAQQHGNEQSGKEGALLLAADLLRAENRYLFDRMDLLLVPQVNPDGSEANRRRNANDMDLNRNHLILFEPETQALHRVFDTYGFEVSMDVHEYSPYGEEWKEYGCRKKSEVTVGTTTNPNVSGNIRELSRNGYLPFIFNYLREKGYSAFEYLPGGPPGINYLRRSTFDINDGRQSLGIQNTFSFIQEGMNGEDNYVENLQRRAEGQCAGMRGLLEYVFVNKDLIKELVHRERQSLISGGNGQSVAIQCGHFHAGERLELPLYSYSSGNDTLVEAAEFRSEVRSLADAEKPAGYLIPRNMPELMDWVARHDFFNGILKPETDFEIRQYYISKIDSIDFEGDTVVNPTVEERIVEEKIDTGEYVFVPTDQLKGNLLVIALEPKSMLGLVTYRDYAHILKAGEAYPILRVIKK